MTTLEWILIFCQGCSKDLHDQVPEKIIVHFPEEVKGTSDSPCKDNLFKVREPGEEELLPEEQPSDLYNTLAQLLFSHHEGKA